MHAYTQPNYGEYRWFCERVARYMGWPENWNTWGNDQEQAADDIIESALMQFYFPPPVELMRSGHNWTFLRPVMRLTTAAAQRSMDLPVDFERFDGRITYVNDSNDYPPIEITSEQRIRQMAYQQEYQSYPVYAAARQKVTDGTVEQRQEIIFHPTPDSTYELELAYVALPKKLSDTYPVPLGGKIYVEAILAGILAEAEMHKDGQQGPRHKRWVDLLSTAVAHDLKRNAEVMGYNGDTSTLSNNRMHKDIRKVRDFLYANVTYE